MSGSLIISLKQFGVPALAVLFSFRVLFVFIRVISWLKGFENIDHQIHEKEHEQARKDPNRSDTSASSAVKTYSSRSCNSVLDVLVEAEFGYRKFEPLLTCGLKTPFLWRRDLWDSIVPASIRHMNSAL